MARWWTRGAVILAALAAAMLAVGTTARDRAHALGLPACTNTHGSYTCTCHDGFSGDGHTCDPDMTPPPAMDSTGCGCRSSNPGQGALFAFALALVLRRRRSALPSRRRRC